MAAEPELASMPYDLRRKTVSGLTYLCEIFDWGGNGKSLGRWSGDTEARFTNYHTRKSPTAPGLMLVAIAALFQARLRENLNAKLPNSASARRKV